MKKIKILDVGSGKHSYAVDFFKPMLENVEYTVTTVDIDPDNEPDILADMKQPFPEDMHNQFQLVLASHCLEHVERSMVIPVMQNLANVVAPRGELWLVVPSLEWAASQIIQKKETPAVQLAIYGGAEADKPNFYYHHSGFTLMSLRDLLRHVGLVEKGAYQQEYKVKINGIEQELPLMQNLVIGAKPDADPVVIG